MKNYTTYEQAQKLVELGLSPDTSDLLYFIKPLTLYNIEEPLDVPNIPSLKGTMVETYIPKECTHPCWSTTQLFKMFPKYIELRGGVRYKLEVHTSQTDYVITYYHPKHSSPLHISVKEDFSDAVYDMAVWWLEQDFLRT